MIEEQLIALKLMGALNFYQEIKTEEYEVENLLPELLKSEISWRTSNRKKRRLKMATFPYEREWSNIDEKKNSKIPFKKLKKYSNGEFAKENKNICFIGAPGLGKTHCAVAIGRDLCELGLTVKFYTAIDLVNSLEEAKEEHRLTKFMDKIIKPNVLIIDELGFVPLSDNGARLLFDVFSKRYEQGPIIVTTNLTIPKWVQTFGSKELTTALADRFSHRCDIYIFEGESYRFMESKQAVTKRRMDKAE